MVFYHSSPHPTLLLGYFIHDTVDIVVSHQARASWEYLVHHIMVSRCGTEPVLATRLNPF